LPIFDKLLNNFKFNIKNRGLTHPRIKRRTGKKRNKESTDRRTAFNLVLCKENFSGLRGRAERCGYNVNHKILLTHILDRLITQISEPNAGSRKR